MISARRVRRPSAQPPEVAGAAEAAGTTAHSRRREADRQGADRQGADRRASPARCSPTWPGCAARPGRPGTPTGSRWSSSACSPAEPHRYTWPPPRRRHPAPTPSTPGPSCSAARRSARAPSTSAGTGRSRSSAAICSRCCGTGGTRDRAGVRTPARGYLITGVVLTVLVLVIPPLTMVGARLSLGLAAVRGRVDQGHARVPDHRGGPVGAGPGRAQPRPGGHRARLHRRGPAVEPVQRGEHRVQAGLEPPGAPSPGS